MFYKADLAPFYQADSSPSGASRADAKPAAEPIPEVTPIRISWQVALRELLCRLQLSGQTERIDQ
jgi:hypothetical protein